ncbi:MAG: (d)CMP kinase [Oscillibacter sp.]|nr:(d)CMP kinase [Oscillibacter sp.]
MKYYSIAIDGPSGAGKSTLARAVAEKFGFLYVDTGAIYRTVGLSALRAGVDPKDAAAVSALLPSTRVELAHAADGLQHMYLNGEDVTEQIRTPEVSMAASAVAAHAEIRAFLLDTQRDLAKTHNVIMDGRDIGTVVLPEADVKIFLTASAQERAWRRTLELSARGTPKPYEEVLAELEARDRDDKTRTEAPLRQAEDAVRLDNSQLTFQETVDALSEIVQERIAL